MKAVKIHISKPICLEFQLLAKQSNRTVSELIRESMAQYLKSLRSKGRISLAVLTPVSLGTMKRPLQNRADFTGDLLEKFPS